MTPPLSQSSDSASDDPSVSNIFVFLREAASKKYRKATFVLMYSVFALTVWKYIPSPPRFADPVSGRCVLVAESFASGEVATVSRPIKPLDGTLDSQISALDFFKNSRKIWAAFFLMGVVPAFCVKYLFREDLTRYGLTWGNARRTLRTFLMFAPIMLALGWLSGGEKAFYAVYPFNPTAGVSWRMLAFHSISYFFLYYLAWEFMFRGFIQRGLTETVGPTTAVCIQVVASTMLHYGHPATETFGCIAGGLLWGFLAIRTKSIFSGWWQHALLGIALDWSLILAA